MSGAEAQAGCVRASGAAESTPAEAPQPDAAPAAGPCPASLVCKQPWPLCTLPPFHLATWPPGHRALLHAEGGTALIYDWERNTLEAIFNVPPNW